MVDKDDIFEYSDIIINNCIEYSEFNFENGLRYQLITKVCP